MEWTLGVLHVRGVQLSNLSRAIWLPVLAFLAFGEELAYRSLMLNGLMVVLRKG